MPRMIFRRIKQLVLLHLAVIPCVVLADQPIPSDYATSKPLLIEIRYCACAATEFGTPPSELLPSFLKQSSILKVGASVEDKGFVSSRELSMGYELKPVEDSPGKFWLSYSGVHKAYGGMNTGNAKLMLAEGQWLNLFGSTHESENSEQSTDVAVRVVRSGGS
ncbi:MAG: hypothetical protein ACTHY7_10540 [Marinobacter sp.]|uniref:hypothetical protein n=1 Tax=Marinobacter sp. TaxID=50741 RepID=UPI003F9703D4